jgi:hypothetical protein
MYVGGLRARLIKDNFFNLIKDSLSDLGWLDSGREHLPVKILAVQLDDDTEIMPNIVSVSEEDVVSDEIEMGSNLSEHIWTYFVEVYAESHAVGLHLATDIRDIVEGRFSSINATKNSFTVFDLTEATPSYLFDCHMESVTMDRIRGYSRPQEKYWWVISLDVVDYYNNEDGDQ